MVRKIRFIVTVVALCFCVLISFLLFGQRNPKVPPPSPPDGDKMPKLEASFYYRPLLSRPGQAIKFYDASHGNPDNWVWSFGDGTTSSEKNPSHIYDVPGVYYVTLRIKRGDLNSVENSNVLIKCQTNNNSEELKADFDFEPEDPQVGVPVRFHDKSSGNPTSRLWQFGYFGFSFQKDPIKTFFSNKRFKVTLNVKNERGSDSCSKYINIGLAPKNIIMAKSCSQRDVQAAIGQANPGDTVIVPNGRAQWVNLTITKGIILKAATPGGVIISASSPAVNDDYSDASNHLIAFIPSNSSTGQPFRLSGFVLDGGGIRSLFLGQTNSPTMTITQFRIDHCTFQNGKDGAMNIQGEIYGVIDNNIIYGVNREFAYNENTWQNMTFDYGTANNRYYEDNVIHCVEGSTTPEGGLGGRYCYRFNLFYWEASYGAQPWFDMHGNMGTGGNLSTMGAEIYGNTLYNNNKSCMIFDQRGGKALVYNNVVVNCVGAEGGKAREEYFDYLNPPSTNPAGQPQHVSESYYWGNVINGNKVYAMIKETLDYGGEEGVVPRWDVHCWKEVPSFNGSTGIGVGLIGQRPSSCTTEGVAWWATDENKLYRWHNGKWETFYTPYTYPHPLRTQLGD